MRLKQLSRKGERRRWSGDGTYFEKTSGDLTLSTNGEMFANGWEEGGNLVYAAVNMTDGSNGLAPYDFSREHLHER